MNNPVIFLIIIPFAASFLVLLDGYLLGLNRSATIAFVAICTCLTLLTIISPLILQGKTINYPVGGWKEPVGINIYMDGLAWIASLIGTLITLLALIFSIGERKYDYKFYFLFLVLLGGMEGIILTGDIFNMFVFFEIVSVASYILIAYPKKERSIMASFNYLLISSLGMGFFLLGIALLYQQTGILSLREIAQARDGVNVNSTLFILTITSLTAGIGVKAAFIPLHTWLPNAHAFAPHPVSAILSGVIIKVSFLAIWRILRLLDIFYLQHAFIWIGAVTAFLAVILAIAQSDCKKLLAYSSISQMGFIIASFGVATSFSLTASLYHILNHSIFKSLLFLSVGAVIYTTGKRKVNDLAGLGKKIPFAKIGFLIGALSICGIPPFNGYASKALIFSSLKAYPFVRLLIFLASVGTVTSFIKLSRVFRGGEKSFSSRKENRKKVPHEMLIPLAVLSTLCVITGIWPHLTTKVISRLLFRENLKYSLSFYSPSKLGSSALALGSGLLLYLFIKSSEGEKTLYLIRKLRISLNNSLLLVIVGFILMVIISLMIKNLP